MIESSYGFWDSPIEAGFFSSFPSLQELHVWKDQVFWTESRPLDKGRHALVNSSSIDLFPNVSIQSKVHEYGGGAFAVAEEMFIFFDSISSSLYLKKKNEELISLAKDPKKRWADFCVSPDQRHVVCVLEDHSLEDDVKNRLVVIDLETKVSKIIHQKYDFYASPKFSPDGSSLAFLFWNSPHMPWEECFLQGISWASLEDLFVIGSFGNSVSQFVWTDKEEIVFASDLNGFWNLYLWSSGQESLIYKKEADFASPLWVLGRKNFELFSFKGEKSLICSFTEKGVDHLGILQLKDKKMKRLDLPFTAIRTLDVHAGNIYFVGGSFKTPLSVIRLNVENLSVEVISSSVQIPEKWAPFISEAQEVSAFSSVDQESVFGFFYPPKNPEYRASKLELPPLIIKCHAGPTAHVQALFNGDVQFWTSRGFAWLDVNYRGSSGFGRKYREALNENWGLLEVQDCLDLALHLVHLGKVNPKGLFAKGSSSGGFTALCMAALSPALKGCVSYYGVADLVLLAQETHKFEKYYLDSLIGSYQEFPSRYEERSPIFQSDQIVCPVLLFHGDQDKVVPLSQTEELQKKIPLAELTVFPGEGHGFRQSDTLKACANIESAFFQKILKSDLL